MRRQPGSELHLAVVYGTRPEIIKVAPLVRQLRQTGAMRVSCVDSGQHGEVVRQIASWFELSADRQLQVQLRGASLNTLSARIFEQLGGLLAELAPDAVLVQGDTTTVSATATAATNLQIPVIHLEAGLRSGDRWSPFPEELNRRVVSQLASLHLTPTAQATANLRREGIAPGEIAQCGNTVIDALNYTAARPVSWAGTALHAVMESTDPVVSVTCHRRENWGKPLQDIAGAIGQLASDFPQCHYVWPLHPNPAIRETVTPLLAGRRNIHLVPPLAYPHFTHLLSRSTLALSDSGGVQEEAPTLNVPVLVMREETERPEGIAAGCARLVGANPQRILAEARRLLESDAARASMTHIPNPYGDGRAAARAADAITRAFTSQKR